MANKWTEIELPDRSGRPRVTNVRVERFEMANGSVKWQVVTKGRKTIGDLHATEAEAEAALAKLAGLRVPGVNDRLYHAVIRHQVYLERYKAGLFKDVSPLMSKAIKDMLRAVDRLPEGSASRARYERVLQEIQEISLEMSNKVADKLKEELAELGVAERDFNVNMMQQTIPAAVGVKVGLPAIDAVRRYAQVEPFQGLVLQEWTKRIGASNTLRARQQLYIGLAEGDSVPKLRKRMEFVGEQSKRDLEMVVRTAVNHVTNQAKASVYAENADILRGVLWRSTLDSRTSDICMARDGEEYPVDDHPTPPAHPNCRSVLIPLVKSYRQLGLDVDDIPPGTRSSMDGQVPATETYNTWLRKQPRDFVEDVLGKEKARLYLDEKISLDKFVDTTGRTLTLKELREKF